MRRNAIFYLFAIVVMATSCSAYDAPFNPQPLLTVDEAVEITRNEATIIGHVNDNGGKGLSALHFQWWGSDGIKYVTPSLDQEGGRVSCRLQHLNPGSTFTCQLRGSNGRVEIASGEMQFATLPNVLPTVSAITPLAKGPASLIASFVIEDNGGEDIIETGCHIRNLSSGTESKVTANLSLTDPANIVVTMTGLDKMASLEVTPYAINAIGEATGTSVVISTDNSISTTSPGSLSQLMGDGIAGYSSLAFSGPMNGDDIRTIREMAGIDFNGNTTAGSLIHIDLTDINIVEGGSNYIQSRATSNDVVGYGMFQNLDKLVSLLLPNSATTIEEQAFLNCSSLQSITIPANATTVEQSDGCTSLSTINVSAANTRFKSIDGVLFNAEATKILWFPLAKQGDYTLPPTVTEIGEYAFRNCHITSFTMPSNITEIGMGAFYGSSVESVILSDNLATIPQATFQNCSSLRQVVIGSAANLIGNYAFDGCPLTDIYISATIPPVCYSDTFSSSYPLLKSCTLHVPESSLARYKAHDKWGKFENITFY